jgi:hypothetical protein
MDLKAAPVNVYNKMLAGIWGCSSEEENGITLNVLDVFLRIMGNSQNYRMDFKYFECCKCNNVTKKMLPCSKVLLF